MALQLEITSPHKALMGEDSVRQFRDQGGTIGRGLRNDWILPDSRRFVSGHHATVDRHSGTWYITDLSTNGVYMNDDVEPLGNGRTRRLFDGDRIRMGEFEFLVSLDEGEELEIRRSPVADAVRDHVDQVVPEEPLHAGVQLLDEEELTGSSALHAALFGTTRMDAPRRATPNEAPDDEAPQKPGRVPAPRDGGAPAELLGAFLEGAGIRPEDIHPAVDPADVLRNAGSVLREFVRGITVLLASRAQVKTLFRLDQTTVLPRDNNPLKLGGSTDDALKQLLVGREGEYLGPLDSVREACRDVKYHQNALLGATISAFREFAARFDPGELEDVFDRSMARRPLFAVLAKLKYWQLYCELYPIMTQTGDEPFPKYVVEELVRGYEKRLAAYRRPRKKDGKVA